jgi:hypothetical protein
MMADRSAWLGRSRRFASGALVIGLVARTRSHSLARIPTSPHLHAVVFRWFPNGLRKARWGWRAPDNRPAAGVSLADVTVRDVTTLFEHAARARTATKLAEFAAEALSDAGELTSRCRVCRTRVRRRCGCCRRPPI